MTTRRLIHAKLWTPCLRRPAVSHTFHLRLAHSMMSLPVIAICWALKRMLTPYWVWNLPDKGKRNSRKHSNWRFCHYYSWPFSWPFHLFVEWSEASFHPRYRTCSEICDVPVTCFWLAAEKYENMPHVVNLITQQKLKFECIVWLCRTLWPVCRGSKHWQLSVCLRMCLRLLHRELYCAVCVDAALKKASVDLGCCLRPCFIDVCHWLFFFVDSNYGVK